MKLKDVADLKSGFAFKSTEFRSEGIPLLRIGEISGDGKIVFTDKTVFVDKDCLSQKKEYIIKKNDVLLALSGATTGKFGIYESENEAILNQRVLRIRSYEQFENKFLFYTMNQLKKKIELTAAGAAQPNISPKEISEFEIWMPNNETQQKIVAVLDQAQVLIDLKKQQLELLQDLTQSIFDEMFGDPVTNPKGWETVKLESCIQNIESGWSPTCENYPSERDEWGVLKLSAVTGGNYTSSENKALPLAIEPKKNKEVLINDLLMTRKNTPELVGDACYVFNTRQKLIFPDTVFRIRTLPKINGLFLWCLLSESKFSSIIKSLASGSAKSMSNISQTKLKHTVIILPPINRQNQFAEKIQAIEAQKTMMQDSLIHLENNYHSLMQRAFKGQLYQ